MYALSFTAGCKVYTNQTFMPVSSKEQINFGNYPDLKYVSTSTKAMTAKVTYQSIKIQCSALKTLEAVLQWMCSLLWWVWPLVVDQFHLQWKSLFKPRFAELCPLMPYSKVQITAGSTAFSINVESIIRELISDPSSLENLIRNQLKRTTYEGPLNLFPMFGWICHNKSEYEDFWPKYYVVIRNFPDFHLRLSL